MKPLTLGLAATAADIEQICCRRLDGDTVLGAIDFLNLGWNPGDIVEPQFASLIRQTGLRVVIHLADVNLSTQVDSDALAALRRAGDDLDALWFEEDLGVWKWGAMSLGLHHLSPVLDAQSIASTASNIAIARKALGRTLLVENPPLYFALGPFDMWSYLSAVGDAADCGLVLDSGHMMGFHINTDTEVGAASGDWPGWRRVREIHVSGFQLVQMRGRKTWIDRHSEPLTQSQLDWVRTALDRMPERPAVCLELDGASPETVGSSISAMHALLSSRD